MNQSIEDASRNSIIEDARAAGFILGSLEGSEIFEKIIAKLTKFAKLREARQSSQSEPVAVFTGKFKGNVNGKQWIECELTGAMPNTGDLLYAAPQQAIPRGWISVKDKLPENERVMTLSPAYAEGEHMRHRIMDGQFVKVCHDVSHWMPLPASPAAPIERDK
jgi:hypothetical protein